MGITSSFCKWDEPQCVEVTPLPSGKIQVTNSHDPERSSSIFSQDEWEAFILGVKNNEFDYDVLQKFVRI